MAAMTALVTGGCGFVGRHVVARLVRGGYDVWVIDDLSTGQDPEQWLPALGLKPDGSFWSSQGPGEIRRFVGPLGETVTCLLADVREVLRADTTMDAQLPHFADVIHLAAVVGGRLKIDGDPLSVATDLAIDAGFFAWAIRARPGRILYASSSAAYPVRLQEAQGNVALREEYIDFAHGQLGMPDMTYGWSKLTGEYLSRIAAQKYGLHVACIRPFSGYGEDQDESYPVPAIAARAARHEDPLTVWGSGLQGRDFVHIEDCVSAMFRILDAVSDGSGVNIGSGKLTTFLEVARLFDDLAGYQPRIVPLEDKPVGVQARYADITRMTSLLNWSPEISIEAGFGRVLAAALERQERAATQREPALAGALA